MKTWHVHVSGVVQGVGFRPFVYGLATRLNLRGWVNNNSAGVDIQIQGEEEQLQDFVRALQQEKPPLARIDSLTVTELPGSEVFSAFEIRLSEVIEGAFQPVAADVALCPDCERELFDPADRRYLYPFINCTNCGPRFTIIQDLPYDRPKTTMRDFPLCADCKREYHDPLNRRFHAQPVACPVCGPRLWLEIPGQKDTAKDLQAILTARRLLREGKIVAVKGLGGFHLACDAANPTAVETLRQRKGRQGKPFALMAADLETVERLCFVSPAARDLLTGREKPIVLLKRRGQTSLAPQVAAGVDTLGFMLPYTPLHHLLLNQNNPDLSIEPVPAVLVMTSGNFSEEPIATDNTEALERLAPLADAFLLHNRDIHIRCDDSVVRVDEEVSSHQLSVIRPGIVHIRRSRGYAPYPVHLPFETRPTLAVGGELKNTFCLTRERYAFLSHHIGDMENAETYASFEQGVEHLSRLFRIAPEIIACDLHPGYFTTTWAARHHPQPVYVQHHHAHIAACMADNGLENRPLIGLAYDGTGYGPDGAIWGGEILIADYANHERAAHLEYLPLPGGDAAIRHPWRIAVGYAHALGLDVSRLPFLQAVEAQAISIVQAQVEKHLNAPPTSSLGRLFDAVAALAGVRNDVTYEAQAAIELETLSRPHAAAAAPYPYTLTWQGQRLVIGLHDLLAAVIDEARRGVPAGQIGARFHRSVTAFSVEICRHLREQRGLSEIALSGGVWQNQLLLDLTRAELRAAGFEVFFHRQTPPNDGGLALGQAVVANYR
jgi:hydrogenase maturation protein HypF